MRGIQLGTKENASTRSSGAQRSSPSHTVESGTAKCRIKNPVMAERKQRDDKPDIEITFGTGQDFYAPFPWRQNGRWQSGFRRM